MDYSGSRGRRRLRSAKQQLPSVRPAMREESHGSSDSASERESEEQMEVVRMEDAVQLLVEHLVAPVLPLGKHVDREQALSPEKQQTVARQVHATVLLYNYYHRKQFPQLEFATLVRFSTCAARTARNKNLLMYLNHQPALDPLVNVEGVEQLSVTEKAIVDACGIAEALDPTKDSPDMTMWPITRVAVLLLHRKKKVCLLERGSITKGVWSVFEKDVTDHMSAKGPADDDESMILRSGAYVLQQIAYSEVELKTGMKRAHLHFIEEHRVYSLSNKGTATMLFVLQYDQTVDSKFMEMTLDALVERMSGPVFKSDPCKRTTSVVDCYHLLPYKEVLVSVLNRDWPLGSSLTAPKQQRLNNNSKSKTKTKTTHISTQKKNKKIVQADGDSGTKNNISKNIRGSKRKIEDFKTQVATSEEHMDGHIPTQDLQAGLEMDNTKENKSTSRHVCQAIIPILDFDPVNDDQALKIQEETVSGKSDCATDNMNVQRYTTLLLLQKMRDDTLREHCVLGDRSAEYEMDIQTILTETEMTPKVTSILKRHENSLKMTEVTNPISSGEGWQTMNIKKKKLKEAIILRNNCQELDNLCRESNWILPRYTVLPSVTSDMYQASIHLMGPDFDLRADGDMKVTPHEARDSAASNMLSRLQQKARED